MVCAVHGMCTGRALLRERVRRRHLLRRHDVLRLARHVRVRVGTRADRAHAPHRPRRHPAHGAHGQPGTRVGHHSPAARAGHRSGGARRTVEHARELARVIASYPTVATQGTVRAIWESLDKPYRADDGRKVSCTRASATRSGWPRSSAPASTARLLKFDDGYPAAPGRGHGPPAVGAGTRVRGHVVDLGELPPRPTPSTSCCAAPVSVRVHQWG